MAVWLQEAKARPATCRMTSGSQAQKNRPAQTAQVEKDWKLVLVHLLGLNRCEEIIDFVEEIILSLSHGSVDTLLDKAYDIRGLLYYVYVTRADHESRTRQLDRRRHGSNVRS